MNVKVTEHNVHIGDSYTMSRHAMHGFLCDLRVRYPDNLVLKSRTVGDMAREWAVHNFLYRLGYKRGRTGSVDLNFPQKGYVRLAYAVLGRVVWPLIK